MLALNRTVQRLTWGSIEKKTKISCKLKQMNVVLFFLLSTHPLVFISYQMQFPVWLLWSLRSFIKQPPPYVAVIKM